MAVGPDNGHSGTTTTSHGRDLEAGSTSEAPKISITAPEDGHGAVGTTINRRSLRADSTFPALPAMPNYERGVVANPFDGRYFVPGSRLRQRGSGAGTQLRQEINANVELDNVSGPRSYIMTAVHTESI